MHGVRRGLLLCGGMLGACSAPEPTAIEVTVRGVEIDTSSRPVILLEDEKRQLGLPIWIGPAEAQAIIMEMQGVEPDRPLTHDLFKNTLDIVGIELEKIVIEDLRDSTYFARLHLRVDGTLVEVDSRPSDAIALALRFRRPVFVASGLFASESTIDFRAIEPGGHVAHEAGLTVQDVTPELAAHFALAPGQGVLVADVDEEAARGLRRGDVILEVDGQSVGSVNDFRQCMRSLDSPPHVTLSVLRDGDRFPVDLDTSSR
jgi:bifunctional DNase/RNase